MIDHQNVERKTQRTQQDKQITCLHRKRSFHAQQIQTAHGHKDGHPDIPATSFSKKDAPDRNQHDIAGCQKAGLSRTGTHGKPDLLQTGRHKQNHSAHDSSQDEIPALPRDTALISYDRLTAIRSALQSAQNII